MKKYADALWKIVEERNINVSLNSCLVEVKSENKEAIFENLQTKEKVWFKKFDHEPRLFYLFRNLTYVIHKKQFTDDSTI